MAQPTPSHTPTNSSGLRVSWVVNMQLYPEIPAPKENRSCCVSVPPHWHPTDENITVLQGSFMIGTGKVFDTAKLTPMDAGSFILMPKTMRHFALCKGATMIQVHGMGPFKINWLNPC